MVQLTAPFLIYGKPIQPGQPHLATLLYPKNSMPPYMEA